MARMTQDEKDQMLALIRTGKMTREIAAVMGRSYSGVQRFAAHEGVPLTMKQKRVRPGDWWKKHFAKKARPAAPIPVGSPELRAAARALKW